MSEDVVTVRPAPAPVVIDPGYRQHPKLVAVGPLAAWLHTAGLCYCAQALTDGHIPTRIVPQLVNLDGYAILQSEGRLVPTYEPALHRDLADALVGAGLWERTPDGFRIHDYLDWNPSRSELLAYAEPDPYRRAGMLRAVAAQRNPDGRYTPNLEGVTAPPVAAVTSPADWGRIVEGGDETAGELQRRTLDGAPVLRSCTTPEDSTHPKEGLHQEPASSAGRERAERKRILFGTLAGIQGSVPGQMSRHEARQVGVALSEILRASPDLTPDEILRRAANLRASFDDAQVTAMALSKWWSTATVVRSRGGRVRDRAAEIVRAAMGEGGDDGALAGPGPSGSGAGVLPPP